MFNDKKSKIWPSPGSKDVTVFRDLYMGFIAQGKVIRTVEQSDSGSRAEDRSFNLFFKTFELSALKVVD